MKTKIFFISIILLFSSIFAQEISNDTSSTTTITILYTNDIHGHINPFRLSDFDILKGGFASLATYIKKIREEEKELIILDAGDVYQGGIESAKSMGKEIMQIMNDIGYTAITLGNHEFDYGIEHLKELKNLSKFHFLNCNILNKNTGKLLDFVEPYIIVNIKGKKIGIIGLIMKNAKRIIMPKYTKDIEIVDPAESVKKYIDILKQEKVDIIIVLSHQGFEEDTKLASIVPGINVIIGGHDNQNVEFQDPVNKTMIYQSYGFAACVGKLDIIFQNGEITYNNQIIDLDPSAYPPDTEILKIVNQYQKDLEYLDTIIGETEVAMDAPYGEVGSSLGNLITDAMRYKTGADIAFENSGGIRANLKKGPIRIRDIYEISTFVNYLVTMEMTGEQILELLETSVMDGNYVLQVSGIEFSYSLSKPNGKRIINATINGKPIDKKKKYKVVTEDYLATGGDNLTVFQKGTNIVFTKISVKDAEIEYIKKISPITHERCPELFKPRIMLK